MRNCAARTVQGWEVKTTFGLVRKTHWCPLLDLSYHKFLRPRLLKLVEKTDAASMSETCQFAIFIAPVERESITKRVGAIKRLANGRRRGVLYHRVRESCKSVGVIRNIIVVKVSAKQVDKISQK